MTSESGPPPPSHVLALTDADDFAASVRSKVYWDKTISQDPPVVAYEQVMSTEEGVWEWLKRIVRFFPATGGA